MTTSLASASALTPEEIANRLVVEPLQRAATAFDPNVTTLVPTVREKISFPVVRKDAAAAWTNEGGEIAFSDPTFDNVTVTPSKIAGMTRVTNELAKDSSPAGLDLVGQSLTRNLATQIDAAFFGNLAAPAPKGLESLPPGAIDEHGAYTYGHSSVFWGNTAAPTSLDPLVEALAVADAQGTNVTAFVTDPATAAALLKLRTDSTDSNVLLLGSDATTQVTRRVLGVPLLVNIAVKPGTIWALDKSLTLAVVRSQPELAFDSSLYFGSDSVAVRVTMRIGFAFPSHPSVIKLTKGTVTA